MNNIEQAEENGFFIRVNDQVKANRLIDGFFRNGRSKNKFHPHTVALLNKLAAGKGQFVFRGDLAYIRSIAPFLFKDGTVSVFRATRYTIVELHGAEVS